MSLQTTYDINKIAKHLVTKDDQPVTCYEYAQNENKRADSLADKLRVIGIDPEKV